MKTIALPSGENFGAIEISLAPRQLAELDAIFPPPAGPRALEML